MSQLGEFLLTQLEGGSKPIPHRPQDQSRRHLLDAGEGNLVKQSVVISSQVSSLYKSRLGEYIGSLSQSRVDEIVGALRFLQMSFYRL